MKRTLILSFFISLLLLPVPTTTSAQTTGQRANEQAHKLTEKIKKKVATLGIGEKVKIDMHDGKHYDGQMISRIDDSLFVIEDHQKNATTLNYTDVRSIGRWTHASSLTKGIVIGVAATVGIIAIIIVHAMCNGEPGAC